jgi:Flp pilus assembly secretin CpaC
MRCYPCFYVLLALFLLSALPSAALDRKTLHVGDAEIYEFDQMTTAIVGSPAVADIVPLSAHRLLVNAKGVGETTLFVYDRRGKHRYQLTVVLPTPQLGALAAQVQSEIGLPAVTVRAVKDTLFLEGAVTSVAALQRAGAIAGVYAAKLRNLITLVPLPDAATGLSLAQTYAALLTNTLSGTGIKVQVIDDKTIALVGQYLSPYPEPSGSGGASPRPARIRKAKRVKADAAAAEVSPEDEAPLMDLKADLVNSRLDALPSDPLDRLLQTLPPELKVVDLINLGRSPARQILVRAKIIDIDRNASKSLGMDWGSLSSGSARGGNSYSFTPQPILFGQLAGQLAGVNGSGFTGGGPLTHIFPLAAQLRALITENKARILSEPSLMVLDGSEGSILVGGEIPIPVAQSSSGTSGVSASVSIEYKPYGVRLLVHAALVGEDRVQLTVTPEVSDLNYGASVQLGGFSVPSLTVRRATTTLQMGDGETLVIGGLYSNTTSREVSRIPLLSQIPVLGELFKSTTTRKEENELLILIQPEIVQPDTPGTHPPAPGSLENLPIVRPGVRRSDFDMDFPELQGGGGDRDKPGSPVNLPSPHLLTPVLPPAQEPK